MFSLCRNILAPLAMAGANNVFDSFFSQRSCFFLASRGSATQSVVAITVFRRACSPQSSLRNRKGVVFPALSSSASEWRKMIPVVRSPCWYLGTRFSIVITLFMISTHCVWKNSCNCVLLLFESETSRRVTMCPLSSSNELLERIVSAEDSADEDSA